jgi:uncharacterized protein YggE
MKYQIKSILFLALLGVLAASAAAQDTNEKLPPSIRTTGEAVVTAQPDRARIDVGVTTQASNSQTAASQNAQKLEAALTRLRTLLGAGADIKTISYTLQPDYRYPQGGGEPTIAGYTATNIVRVTVDDLTKVGSVIDTATEAGANRIQQLEFTVRDERPLEAQALREAAARARQKADALAGALGVRVTRVLNVSESGAVAVPPRVFAYAKAEAASTPIEPGTIEVRASVTLTVEIAP